MPVKASIMRIIQTSGRLTRATGAYNPRNEKASRSLRLGWTRSRWTSANTNWDKRGKPCLGRTTVLSAEPSTASATKAPRIRASAWVTIMACGPRRASDGSRDRLRGLLHRLVDLLPVDLEFFGHLLPGPEVGLLDGVFDR